MLTCAGATETAGERDRTFTPLRVLDFESSASANSATPAAGGGNYKRAAKISSAANAGRAGVGYSSGVPVEKLAARRYASDTAHVLNAFEGAPVLVLGP